MTTAHGLPLSPSFRAGNFHHATAETAAPGGSGAHGDGLSAFLSVRPRLFGIAYRMLGSAVEAEDIVQDVWVRWQTTDRTVVRDTAAFLTMTTTRLAINVIQSARARRETCVGPWLPEPVDTSADPALGAERGEALQSAVRVLLEKLSPAERAAYVLREAFGYRYRDIAGVLRLEEANTRQLVTRARQHVADSRRAPVSSIEQRRLLHAFVAAAERGDVAELEGLFASDIVFPSDGAGSCVQQESSRRTRARREVYRGGRGTFLTGRDTHVGAGKRSGVRAPPAGQSAVRPSCHKTRGCPVIARTRKNMRDGSETVEGPQ